MSPMKPNASLSLSQERFKKSIDTYGKKAQYLLAGQPDDVKSDEENPSRQQDV